MAITITNYRDSIIEIYSGGCNTCKIDFECMETDLITGANDSAKYILCPYCRQIITEKMLQKSVKYVPHPKKPNYFGMPCAINSESIDKPTITPKLTQYPDIYSMRKY